MFAWPRVSRWRFFTSLPRHWFSFVLSFAKIVGLRLVFTWHDVLPLNAVFDDDRAARDAMLHRIDRIITINESARRTISRDWSLDPLDIAVIPEGAPTVIHSNDRASARTSLGVGHQILIAVFGHIDPYKGTDALLAAALSLDPRDSYCFRLLGEARDPVFAGHLTGLIEQLRAHGTDVEWINRRFEDHELESLLIAADVVALPFKRITNSTTMRMGMAYNKVVLLPDIDELSDIPRDAAFFFDASEGGLADGLARLIDLWPQGMDDMATRGREWATSWTWEQVAEATKAVYEKVVAIER
jgi:glycosyltransferase involved in cell wall biosynthesis